jgi:hypothetical protein
MNSEERTKSNRREKKRPSNKRKVEKGPESPGHFLQYKSNGGRITAKERAIIRNKKRAARKRELALQEQKTKEVAVSSAKETDVHTRHCCKDCGCKYGEDKPEESPFVGDDEPFIACSVVSGRRKQEYTCGKQSTCYHED